MKYLLDANMVIYYLRGRPSVVRRLEDTRPGDRYLSLITLGELYHGIFNSVPWQKNLVRYRSFFGRTKILPFTPDVAEYFGRVRADLQKRGAMVADNDHGLPLTHLNTTQRWSPTTSATSRASAASSS